jgi:hypothetical protein
MKLWDKKLLLQGRAACIKSYKLAAGSYAATLVSIENIQPAKSPLGF